MKDKAREGRKISSSTKGKKIENIPSASGEDGR
jgi:hypothetical protein